VKLYSELKDLGYDGAETLYIATNKQTKQDETFSDKNQAELMVKAGTHEKARVEILLRNVIVFSLLKEDQT